MDHNIYHCMVFHLEPAQKTWSMQEWNPSHQMVYPSVSRNNRKKNRGSFRLINLNISTPNQKIYLYTRAMRNSRGSISIIRQENLPSAILILKVISQYISMNMKNITYHVQIYLYAMKPINLFHNKILWMGYHKNSKNVL